MPIEVRDLNGGIGVFIAGHGVIKEKNILLFLRNTWNKAKINIKSTSIVSLNGRQYRKRRFPQEQLVS